ncbi:MAG: SDR family oxidoreductase [Lactobacillus sp.]|uniref:SDR family oxidoreductase n=1 Tax=Bombilactobacillus bombi TaxID=1303590 RepID=UPI0035E5F57C|nr:SDR family oxidoreductase [Lactobacillus sp.]
MKVLVIGAHGQIGRLLVAKLQVSQHEVTAGLRSTSQIEDYQEQGYQTALVDVEKDITHLQAAMKDQQAVVFAVGSGGKTGADKTMMVDLDGAVKAMEAAKKADIERFIIISAIGAQNRSLWSYQQRELSTGNYYYAAKYYADEWLLHSGLAYTIIRPAALTNATPTGKVVLGPQLDLTVDNKVRTITRSDVAQTVVECLNQPRTINQAFDISNGDILIAQALAKLSS